MRMVNEDNEQAVQKLWLSMTEGELRDWRRTISDDPNVNVERLTDIAFSCKLDDLWAEQARHKSVQKESVPMIICTEALV